MPNFECLYYLENFYLYIIEVKRCGIPDGVPANEKFKWLRVDKETLEVNELHFRSMDSSGEIEERFFDEGFLKFNKSIGTYIEKFNSAQHPLENKSSTAIPQSLSQLVDRYLTRLPEAV